LNFADSVDILPSEQISALISVHDWQARNDNARATDQQELSERLIQLETNQQRLTEILSKWLQSIVLLFH